LVALAGLYKLAQRHASPRAAGLAVWCMCFFPASFVFSMICPSSVFLAASVWAFVLIEDHHDLAAGGLAACAAIVRPNGVIVAIALTIAVM
jgi:Gpi18-like mannosyltransferase